MRDLGSQCSKTGAIVMAEELLQITIPKLQATPSGSISSRVKTIKIFLASSSELKDDRKEFEICINRENKRLSDKGIFLRLEIWEDYIDAMSQTRLQDEYNKVISECDIFFCIFFSKVGKYTTEEFEKAWKNFKQKGKPMIYTYFKDAPVNMNEIKKEDINSKFDFQEKLKQLGHFPTIYKNTEDLSLKIKMQVEKFLSGLQN